MLRLQERSSGGRGEQERNKLKSGRRAHGHGDADHVFPLSAEPGLPLPVAFTAFLSESLVSQEKIGP